MLMLEKNLRTKIFPFFRFRLFSGKSNDLIFFSSPKIYAVSDFFLDFPQNNYFFQIIWLSLLSHYGSNFMYNIHEN